MRNIIDGFIEKVCSLWHKFRCAFHRRHVPSDTVESDKKKLPPSHDSMSLNNSTCSKQDSPLPDKQLSSEQQEIEIPQSERPPDDIGGKRSDQSNNLHKLTPKSNREYVYRPELICRDIPSERALGIFLSAHEKCNIEKVCHNSKDLEMEEGAYRLLSFRGSLTIFYKDESDNEELRLFDEGDLLIFKLTKGNTHGHRIQRITNGHFVVIVPSDWKRRGDEPIESRGCIDDDFTAHHFLQKRDSSNRDIDGFNKYPHLPCDSYIEIHGKSVFDDSDEGTLFVGDVPQLINLKGDIVWVRVGEEKKGGWKGENFKPKEKTLKDILNGRQGRFFIRAYDNNSKLVDSEAFRYFRDLEKILVDGKKYTKDRLLVPSLHGYKPTKIHFDGIDGFDCDVKPHPDKDHQNIELKAHKSSIRVTLDLPRIWWRMVKNNKPENWQDKPFNIKREKFHEAADTDIIQLRLPKRIKSVKIGFDNDSDNHWDPYRCEPSKPVNILMRDYRYSSQIDDALDEDVSLCVQCGGVQFSLIRIPASVQPTPESHKELKKDPVKNREESQIYRKSHKTPPRRRLLQKRRWKVPKKLAFEHIKKFFERGWKVPMPRATAIWLYDNTILTFEQIACFTGLHYKEVEAVSNDLPPYSSLMPVDPVKAGLLSLDEIKRCEADPAVRLNIDKKRIMVIWLYDNTTLTFEQIADFVSLPLWDVKAIIDKYLGN